MTKLYVRSRFSFIFFLKFFIKKMDYFEKGPLLVVADIFSIVTILSCLVVKVPQIKIIQENKSAAGKFCFLFKLIFFKTFFSRNQLGWIVIGTMQLHCNDVLQLCQRLFLPVLYGIPHTSISRIHFNIYGIEILWKAQYKVLYWSWDLRWSIRRILIKNSS